MPLIFSNGPLKDFVKNPFQNLLTQAVTLFLAAPYFTEYADIVEAAHKGKHIDLIIGLNPLTSHEAVKAVLKEPNISVRYFTDRFHAKIYLSDQRGILGSANLTAGGLLSNREAVCVFDPQEDGDKLDELRALFSELWETAPVLTDDIAQKFAAAMLVLQRRGFNPDAEIIQALGVVEPTNIGVQSGKSLKNVCFSTICKNAFTSNIVRSFLK